jgi:hypothetical protein
VLTGFLVIFTEQSVFDPIIASVIALWIIVSTVREVLGSREELIWPEKIVWGHPTAIDLNLPWGRVGKSMPAAASSPNSI